MSHDHTSIILPQALLLASKSDDNSPGQDDAHHHHAAAGDCSKELDQKEKASAGCGDQSTRMINTKRDSGGRLKITRTKGVHDHRTGDYLADGKDEEPDDHEMHIWTERERRKKMRNMFAHLHALLPQLPPKADKSTIVDEAVKYIKTLQLTLQSLQNKKLEKLRSTYTTTTALHYDPPPPAYSMRSMALPSAAPSSTTTREAIFLADDEAATSNCSLPLHSKNNNINIPHFPVIFQTWTSPNVVLNVCRDEAQITVCSTTKPRLLTAICFVLDKYNIDVISAHVSSDANRSIYTIQAHASGPPEQFPADDIYRQAAGEIMLWVTS